ncbi:hypothetical protein PRZ48_003009 [Zasmidium cellare]|uniref:N-acetyltransferase domain-containing protein n=1 Tax=Zasmidium cellare TaxID=395010 RepID=A0ABR0EV38_ZASCE|nr:hypothetical protein PRZ48_003009 [Zasmidium cellare]
MTTLHSLFPPHLSTPRLTLDRFDHSPAHYDTLLTAMNSPTAHTHMGDFHIRTPAQLDAFNAIARIHDPRFKDGIADDDCYYVIRLGPNNPKGELIGGVSIRQCHAKDPSGNPIDLAPDMGWCMLEGHMGQGYATEAARELMRYAREEVGWKELSAFASEKNPMSNRVAEKLGFVEGGSCPDLDAPAGELLSLYVLPGMERIDERLKGGLGFSMAEG